MSSMAAAAAAAVVAATAVPPAGSTPLPKYTGPQPPWQYNGWASFPSFFFGANQTGPEPPAELALIAKHQFAGWGWQQDVDVTPASDDGHFYSEETASAQAATRLASYVEFSGAAKKTQGIFVYRHSQMALSWYTIQRAAYNNSANSDFWMRGNDGKICVDKNRGGPVSTVLSLWSLGLQA
eukprot:SAG31_NODE_3673_length_3999_cov_2.498974_1_plen_181_part_00